MPVEFSVLGAFVVAAGALVLSPGPDTILILRYTLDSGQRTGLATVAGVQVGLILHTLLAVAGISLVIASSPVLFRAVAVAGAAYLAWLGLQSFRARGPLRLDGGGTPVTAARAFRHAVLCNLLNPKVILLFLALFPNFVDTGRDDVTAQLLTLAATLIFINVLWQTPLAWAGDVARRWLARPGILRAVQRATGAILLFFAATMLIEHLL
ncbi:MAG: LysE family translocator [Rhodospirillales bacterium]|nr:LysE family translocator [Rhodospirillales bacterium]